MAERSMTVPIISLAQVRILQEEVIDSLNAPDGLPNDLTPSTPFDEAAIRAGLPDAGPFRLGDLRCCADRDAHLHGPGGDGAKRRAICSSLFAATTSR